MAAKLKLEVLAASVDFAAKLKPPVPTPSVFSVAAGFAEKLKPPNEDAVVLEVEGLEDESEKELADADELEPNAGKLKAPGAGAVPTVLADPLEHARLVYRINTEAALLTYMVTSP